MKKLILVGIMALSMVSFGQSEGNVYKYSDSMNFDATYEVAPRVELGSNVDYYDFMDMSNR